MCGSNYCRPLILLAAIILSVFIFSNILSPPGSLMADEDNKSFKHKDPFDWKHLRELNRSFEASAALPDGSYRTGAQPDGTLFQFRRMGTRSYSWLETKAGYIIERNQETGYFEYLRLDKKKRYKLSGVVVGTDRPRDFGIKRFVREPNEVVAEKVNDFFAREGRSKVEASSKKKADFDVPPYTPSTGTVKQLVILAKFPGRDETYSRADFERFFNEEGYDFEGAHGSYRDYYLEASYGLLDMDTTVSEWVTLPNSIDFYCDIPSDENPRPYQTLVEHAVAALDATGFDFSPFDGNGDGHIDSLCVMHQGEGREVSHGSFFIWSKMYDDMTPIIIDGKTISFFYTVPELKQNPFDLAGTPAIRSRVGIACHEFGHMMGLEDLYDPGPEAGIGDWGLMGSGNYNSGGHLPAHPMMYQKILLGWVTPVQLTTSQSRVELRRSDKYPEVYKIARNMRRDEYLLLENRQSSGFDAGLPGHGLIVTHVDDQIVQNVDPDRYKVAILQADGERELETAPGDGGDQGDSGDPFPGREEVFNLTPHTDPSTNANSGRNSLIYITNIAEASREIVFDLGIGSAPDNPYWPGPDTFGYIGSKESGGFEDISSTGTAVTFSNRKDGTATISFPNKFKFYFYRTKKTKPGFDIEEIGTRSCRVSTNGWLSFYASDMITSISSHPANKVIPNSLAPYYLMAPLWDDFRVDKPGTYVKYKLIGTKKGKRTLIIQWSVRKQTKLSLEEGRISPAKKPDAVFQVKLHESGIIEYCYNRVGTADNKATIGLQKDGITGLRYSTDGERDISAGDRLMIVRNNYSPYGSLVTPGGASGRGTTFAATFVDPDGNRDLKDCYFLVAGTATPANGVYITYNNSTGKIGLRNNANTGWIYGTPGAASVISNNRAELDLSGASVSKSTNMATVSLPISFKAGFAGLKNIYLKATDKVGHESEWGSIWTYNIRANSVPLVTGFRSAIGKGNHDTFTCEFRDMNGSSDVKAVYFLMNDHFSTNDAVYLKYTLADNIVWLRNVSDTAWVKGTAGSGALLSNNNADIGLSGTGMVTAGVNLEFVFPIVFKAGFSGLQQIFLKVEDYSGATSDWRPMTTYFVN